VPKRAASTATRFSSVRRASSGWLCRLAHAPMRLSSARLEKYASLSSPGERTIGPSTRTCRPNASQWNTADARGFAASSAPLRLS
jgi:hypothetical protein